MGIRGIEHRWRGLEFRREVEIPAAWRGPSDFTLSLGPIDDFDISYVGGVQVGSIGEKTPNAHTVPAATPSPAAW